MNRLIGVLFCGLFFGSLGWSQSVWRGQAEVWTSPDAPSEGFLAASNEFPRNSLLKVENFKSQKSIDVRVVSGLPDGSTALVLLNAKAAAALDIKSGEVPMVGVSPDTASSDLSQNPDPDINPAADAPMAVAVAPPVAVPVPAPGVATTTDSSSDETDTPRADVPAPAPLPVVPETTVTPSTPGKTVFDSTDQPAPPAPTPDTSVAAEPAATSDAEAAPPAAPTPETAPATTPDATPLPPAGTITPPETTPVTTPASATPENPPVVAAPPAEAPPLAAPLPTPAPPLAVTPTALPGSNAWVSEPQLLKGPVLGQVVWIPALDHGKAYVQVGAWPTRAALVATLDTVKSYIPLVLYNAKGEKNPWRLLASAPHSQLGVLLNSYRAQGFGRATVVKG